YYNGVVTAIAHAYLPNGLPAGSIITAAFTGSQSTHFRIGASSWHGLSSTSPVDVSGQNGQGGVTGWSSGGVTTTQANDLVFAVSMTTGAATSTPNATYTELHDFSS